MSAQRLEAIQALCPGAQELSEAGIVYVYLPGLKLPCCEAPVDALLCPQQHGGYSTRLFLERPFAQKGQNWTVHHILGRPWHTMSYNGVSVQLPWIEILANHLGSLK